MLKTVCRGTLGLLAVAYVLALGIGLIGTFGWLGQEQDPLSWVFVVLLGQPWVALVGDMPEPVRPWLAALCPLLNLMLLAALCRIVPARRPPAG